MPTNAWDQLDDETDYAYQSLMTYINMERPRPRFKTFCNEEGRPAYITVRGWIKRYKWRSRIRAYDEYVDSQKTEIKVSGLELHESLISHETDSYDRLRELWDEGANAAEVLLSSEIADDVKDGIAMINSLALARVRIDNIGRRAAKMPNVYKEQPKKPSFTDDRPLALSFNEGPQPLLPDMDYDRTSTSAPSESEESERESD